MNLLPTTSSSLTVPNEDNGYVKTLWKWQKLTQNFIALSLQALLTLCSIVLLPQTN